MLEKLEKAYAAGNTKALWDALLYCARWKEPLPPWVCEALELANIKNFDGTLGSFDKVFGRPNTKARAERLKRDHYHALEIADMADKAEGRSEEWFEKAGNLLSDSVRGKSKVKELLYYARFVLLKRAGK